MISRMNACIPRVAHTLNSLCSAVSANLTEILHPASFHPLTSRPCKRSMISSAAVRDSNLRRVKQVHRRQTRVMSTHRTKAIILGGLLRRVWKKRELMIR